MFAQIWIGADDKLPRKLRAVYLNDPLMLRHDMDLSNWLLDPKIAPGMFSPREGGIRHEDRVRASRRDAGQHADTTADGPADGIEIHESALRSLS